MSAELGMHGCPAALLLHLADLSGLPAELCIDDAAVMCSAPNPISSWQGCHRHDSTLVHPKISNITCKDLELLCLANLEPKLALQL